MVRNISLSIEDIIYIILLLGTLLFYLLESTCRETADNKDVSGFYGKGVVLSWLLIALEAIITGEGAGILGKFGVSSSNNIAKLNPSVCIAVAYPLLSLLDTLKHSTSSTCATATIDAAVAVVRLAWFLTTLSELLQCFNRNKTSAARRITWSMIDIMNIILLLFSVKRKTHILDFKLDIIYSLAVGSKFLGVCAQMPSWRRWSIEGLYLGQVVPVTILSHLLTLKGIRYYSFAGSGLDVRRYGDGYVEGVSREQQLPISGISENVNSFEDCRLCFNFPFPNSPAKVTHLDQVAVLGFAAAAVLIGVLFKLLWRSGCSSTGKEISASVSLPVYSETDSG